jgi:hypothetical protein
VERDGVCPRWQRQRYLRCGDSGGPLLVQEDGLRAVAGIAFVGSQKLDCAAAATRYYVKAAHPEVQAFITNLVPEVIRR